MLVFRMLAIAVASIFVLAAVSQYLSGGELQRRFEDEALIIANSATANIDVRVLDAISATRVVASVPTTRSALASANGIADTGSLFTELLLSTKTTLHVDALAVAGIDRVVVAAAQDGDLKRVLDPKLVARASSNPDQAFILFDEPRGVTVRAISIVRDDATNAAIGFVEAATILDAHFLQTVPTTSRTDLLLVWRGRVKGGTVPVSPSEFAQLPTVADIERTARDSVNRNVMIGGRSYYGVFSLERTHDPDPLLFGVLVETASVDLAQRALIATIALLTAAIVVAVTILTYRVVSSITSPLEALAAAAQRIQAGDLSVRLDSRSPYEVGTLQLAFDTMARALKEREREQQEYLGEVRAVNAVADAVVGVTDRDRIFTESLGRLATLLRAEAASVVVRGDASAGGASAAATLNIDPALAVRVAEPVMASRGAQAGIVQRSELSYGPLRSAAHVPLLVRGGVTGVLSVYFAEVGELSESEARALNTITRLISVAQENADLVGELRDNNFQLERANRLKSEFLANVSHELRTPMNAIIGYSRLMLDGLDGELTPQQQADLERVTTAADNLLQLINGLLDLSKIEAGRMDLNLEEVELRSLAHEVAALIGPQAAAKGLEVRNEIAPEVATVHADRARIRQIIVNLVSNAVKFTDEGAVVLTASAEAGWVTMSVVDSGIGISEEAQAFIFDEFRQADASTTRHYGGTGLGLAISKRLIALHGGTIWVESVPGRGSTFRFTLPVHVSAAVLHGEA
jgi:signal transduction histidine kinase